MLKSFLKRCKECFFDPTANVMVEFGLVAPLLILLIFADLEFCLIMAASSVLEGAVLAAAREGSTGYTGGQQSQFAYLNSLVQSRVKPLLDPSKLTFSIPSNSDTPGQIAQYQATYPWPIPVKYLSKIIATNGVFTITATAIVQNEYHP